MTPRCFSATSILCAVLSVPIAGQIPSVAAQGQQATTAPTKPWNGPRTPDGQPDLQGVWDFRTITPLERPKALGDKQVLTDEEAATFEKEIN